MEHWAQKCDGAGCPPEYIAVCKERDELKSAFDGAQMALKALNEKLVACDAELQKVIAELHEVKSERDAAVADMGRMLDNCKACVHQNAAPAICDCECLECKKKCACGECCDGSRFEWQGIKEESK